MALCIESYDDLSNLDDLDIKLSSVEYYDDESTDVSDGYESAESDVYKPKIKLDYVIEKPPQKNKGFVTKQIQCTLDIQSRFLTKNSIVEKHLLVLACV